MVSTPRFATVSITICIAGINASQPSRPKRFSEDHFFFKYSSNLFKDLLLIYLYGIYSRITLLLE